MNAGAQLRLLLDPQGEHEHRVVEHIIATMPGQLPILAALLHRVITGAMRDAGAVARQECLLAVATVVAEVHGPDAVYEAFQPLEVEGRGADVAVDQLDADQRSGDERRAEQ